jgi:serine/threonine-protein phosphatase 2A regulatory subunit B
MLPMEYAYLTEFQAHLPDFDYLKSIEIAEKINSISWLTGTGNSHLLLSANDKQANLWKVCLAASCTDCFCYTPS